MGVNRRTPEMQERQRRADADRAARADAAEVIARWNERLAAGRPAWFSPTLGAALIAGHYLARRDV
jgi:hypothetical protein